MDKSDKSPERKKLKDIEDDIADLDIAIDTKSCGTMEDESDSDDKENYGSFAANMQEKLFEIIENEEVEDVVDLNQKFLAQSFGVDEDQLAILPKIELRVDTRCHNLQVTGEILSSLEFLKLNDSIISSFRDIGTSFKSVRVLNIARCELKEVQGI
jgi:hypothetical protein